MITLGDHVLVDIIADLVDNHIAAGALPPRHHDPGFNPIRISLILPNRNHAAELETSLAAVIGQIRPFDEIIVIDDASTDHSRKVIERFSQERQIILLQNEQRLGVAGAVNRGLAAATGSHIVMASADEMIMPTMCEALADTVARFPGVKVAVSRYTEWDADSDTHVTHDDSSPLGMWYTAGPQPQFFSPEQFRLLLRRDFVWLGVNTAIFDRAALAEVGGFDPALQWHSDWFAMYAIAFRYGFGAVPQSLSWFRVTPESYSGRGMRDRAAQRTVVRDIAAKLYRPEFADFRAGVFASPAALSPFVGRMLVDLPRWPRFWPLWARLMVWWLNLVVRGQRPGVGRRLLGRLRATFQQDQP